MLYSIDNAGWLLGCLCLKPELLFSDKYRLTPEDFEPQRFHAILFGSIKYLAENGAQSIGVVELDTFLKDYEVQYNIAKDHDFMSFVETAKQLCDPNNFDFYYNDIKKFSLIRKYRSFGFDITPFYDESKGTEEQNEHFNTFTIGDIVNWFESRQLEVKKQFDTKSTQEEIKVGDGFEAIMEQFKQKPMYGSNFASQYLTEATRGIINGQLMCFSSPAGTGKTSLAISTLVLNCATEIWDDTLKKFVKNKCKAHGGLLMQFELNSQLEITPKFVASISGVPVSNILSGHYIGNQEERVQRAIEILHESNIYTVDMPNFTIQAIDTTIKDHVLNKGVTFVVWDYLQEIGSLSAEIMSQSKISLRTDQILLYLASALKDMARKYDVPIYTMSQVNANIDSQEILDAGCIAGSRAVANKLDIGAIIMPIRPKEERQIQPLLDRKGLGPLKPTHVIHMYKMRFSQYPMNIKIFVNIDLGTCRMKDLFVTTWDNKPIKIPKKLIDMTKKAGAENVSI